MADLRELLEHLGFTDARSLLQSGNLVFRSGVRTGAPLERMLETGAAQRLSLETDVFVRTADEWKQMIARSPFEEEARRDPGHLVVVFLKEAPAAGTIQTLQEAITGPEVVRASGSHLYISYPEGIGRSKLTTALIERNLGSRGTARNWNTVLKLGAAAADL